DPEVCRLLALLHLRRGELAVAKAEFQFLAEAAMRAKEYELAESMLGEYLKTEPTCVALLELLGRVCQQKGDRASAVAQYGKALTLLVDNPAADNPVLPAELYASIKSLDPDSPFVSRFAPVFEPTDPGQEALSVPEPAKPAQPSEQDREPPYELGVALKHTGLLNEATEEGPVAADVRARVLDAYRILAAWLKEQGRNKEAIAAMELALADSRCIGTRRSQSAMNWASCTKPRVCPTRRFRCSPPFPPSSMCRCDCSGSQAAARPTSRSPQHHPFPVTTHTTRFGAGPPSRTA